ncbi:MAG TPA: hypothetical protein VFL96_05155 [Acidobacteriaceae bacterium]|nr:hypothetical protein [Acidobacteriaceae bacterium]
MKKQLQLGLVVEGKTNNSPILRLGGILEQLGPVKSENLAVAARVSNFLHAGYAVSRFDDLQAARIVLLHVPDGSLPRIIDALCGAGIPLDGMSFVLCESWLTSEALEPLARRGASVATIVEAAANRNWFVAEGDTVAARQIRKLVEQSGDARAFELRRGTKPLYFAAELLVDALATPLFLSAEEALRASGISGKHLRVLLREIGEKAFRDLLKGGRGHWGGPLTECSPETAESHLALLRQASPALAETVDRQLAWASERMLKRKPTLAGA